MQKSENDYIKFIWRIHRMRKFALSLCAIGVVLAFVSSALPELGSTTVFIAACICLAFAVFLGALITMRSCPRCGETLFLKSYWQNVFSRKCLHCGLSLCVKKYQHDKQGTPSEEENHPD